MPPNRRRARYHRAVQLHQGGTGENAENVLIIRDKALAAQYKQNRQAHARHGQPHVGKGVAR